jgi:hypothetical protein
MKRIGKPATPSHSKTLGEPNTTVASTMEIVLFAIA